MINIAHFLSITPKNAETKYFQNFFYFPSTSNLIPVPGTASPGYMFAPFRVEGAVTQLNGENDTLQILFPFTTFGVRLVEEGDGNRLSRMEIRTVWLENNGTGAEFSDYLKSAEHVEYYTGIGASFSDTTIELRFKNAMDSVNGIIPAQTFTRKNAGILPLNSDISLR